MTVLHVHAQDIVRNDAVGNFARQVADLASRSGWSVRLWANHADTFETHTVEHRSGFRQALSAEDVIFFNHSIYDPLLGEVAELSNRKILYFHGITPPELIDPLDERTADFCRRGLAQRSLASRFDALMANSTATAVDLLGGMDADDRVRWQGRIQAVPPVIGLDRWQSVESEPLPLREGRRYLLFVGRIVPHKNVVFLLDVFERLSDRLAGLDLHLVGGPPSGPYVGQVASRAAALNTLGRGMITLRNGISDGTLRFLYENATALLTFSRHEGFCVPLIDALTFDKPVLMSAGPAMIDVMGGAALLVSDNPDDAAGQIAAFLSDPAALASNAVARRGRLEQLRALADGRLILNALEALRP